MRSVHFCRGCPRTESETRQIYDTDDLFGEGCMQEYNILRLALDRIIIHNALFPETALTVLGFAHDRNNAFVVVVQPPYVSWNPINPDERMSFMYEMGFQDDGMDYGMHLNYKIVHS